MDSKNKKPAPDWAREFAKTYRSGTINQYLLHGNIHDFVRMGEGDKVNYVPLRTYLQDELFGSANIVVLYDRSSGIRFRTMPSMKVDFIRFLESYDTVNGTTFSKSIPADPVRAFSLLELYFRKRMMENPEKGRFAITLIIEYAETLIPMANAANYGNEDRAVLVFLQRWANEGIFEGKELAIVLLAENIVNLNQQYVKNPKTFEANIPYPSEAERLSYIEWFFSKQPEGTSGKMLEMGMDVLAKNTAGLNMTHLRVMLSELVENKITFTYADLNRKKKELIEAEAAGLLEFVQSKFSLADVAGHKWAKAHLMETSRAVKSGRQDVVPMGYLVAGPVGTGKTFLITCFANDIGVPMVILKNFRSKYQGETEGNLEKVLNLLKAMTPVAVMIDEADAYLGQRNAEGDSGVSSRVFSMIASFMSNTENRGKIIWFLVTARPDLMPVDFKRQGRAEEHIALFYPTTPEEKKELFMTMLKKTNLQYFDPNSLGDDFFATMAVNSGAEMEAALTRAKFRAVAEGAEQVTADIVKAALEDFLPPTYPAEIELMNYAAVLECTSKALLPESYKALSRQQVVERVQELKAQVERNL
jgi:AAA+ superfamily predicted ATPase